MGKFFLKIKMKFALLPLVGALSIQSRPACTSFECKEGTAAGYLPSSDSVLWTPQHDHPRDYFVPNFGIDTDIGASLDHSKDWTPTKKKDKDGEEVWDLPSTTIEFRM